MENEELIRQQMEETRTSLTEKLETLENKVAGTVEEATCAVSETVEAIKETVQETVATVKDSVRDTVSTVKDSVEGGVTTVKGWFDLPAHFEEHPWIMFGGSVAAGYLMDCLLNPAPAEASAVVSPALASMAPSASSMPGMREASHVVGRRHHHNGGSHGSNGGAREKRRAQEPSMMQALMMQFGPEINKLKSLALGTLFGTIREMVAKAVPEHTGHQLKELIDSATEKLGGERIPESDYANWQRRTSTTRRMS